MLLQHVFVIFLRYYVAYCCTFVIIWWSGRPSGAFDQMEGTVAPCSTSMTCAVRVVPVWHVCLLVAGGKRSQMIRDFCVTIYTVFTRIHSECKYNHLQLKKNIMTNIKIIMPHDLKTYSCLWNIYIFYNKYIYFKTYLNKQNNEPS